MVMSQVLSLYAELLWRVSQLEIRLRTTAPSRQKNTLQDLIEAPQVDPAYERITCLESILRRFPFWKHGHLLVGELALDVNDIAAAYASAHALQALGSRSRREEAAALFLLARCYLRRGLAERSIPLFQQVLQTTPVEHDASEDLAAALAAVGRISEAADVLSKIAPEDLSPAGQAALKFFQAKLQGTAEHVE